MEHFNYLIGKRISEGDHWDNMLEWAEKLASYINGNTKLVARLRAAGVS